MFYSRAWAVRGRFVRVDLVFSVSAAGAGVVWELGFSGKFWRLSFSGSDGSVN